jgi:hypothetical protein
VAAHAPYGFSKSKNKKTRKDKIIEAKRNKGEQGFPGNKRIFSTFTFATLFGCVNAKIL